MIINLCMTTIPPMVKSPDGSLGPDSVRKADIKEVWTTWIEGSDAPGCVAKDPYTAIGSILRQELQFGTWETPEELKIESYLAEQYLGFLKDDPEGHLRDVGKSLYQAGEEKRIGLEVHIHTSLESVDVRVEVWTGQKNNPTPMDTMSVGAFFHTI